MTTWEVISDTSNAITLVPVFATKPLGSTRADARGDREPVVEGVSGTSELSDGVKIFGSVGGISVIMLFVSVQK